MPMPNCRTGLGRDRLTAAGRRASDGQSRCSPNSTAARHRPLAHDAPVPFFHSTAQDARDVLGVNSPPTPSLRGAKRTKQSIPRLGGTRNCFAALAMTVINVTANILSQSSNYKILLGWPIGAALIAFPISSQTITAMEMGDVTAATEARRVHAAGLYSHRRHGAIPAPGPMPISIFRTSSG